MLLPSTFVDACHTLGIQCDSVRITGVKVVANHGVFDFEREERKPFIVDTEVVVDTARAREADDVSSTMSYADLADDATEVIGGNAVNLLETLAGDIAARAIKRGALAVSVTVHKPEAPVEADFTDASVTVRRLAPIAQSGKIRHYVLGIGANLGDAEGTFRNAVDAIGALPVHITGIAQPVITQPLLAPGQAPQPPYLNSVVTLDSALSPLELLAELQRIEVRYGRVRIERWGARALDIDMVGAYDYVRTAPGADAVKGASSVNGVNGVNGANSVNNEPGNFSSTTAGTPTFRENLRETISSHPALTLPHPRAHERLFVLEPWASIEPWAWLSKASAEPSANINNIGSGSENPAPTPILALIQDLRSKGETL